MSRRNLFSSVETSAPTLGGALALLAGLTMLLGAACAPGSGQGPRQDAASGGSTAPKVLRMGFGADDEPTTDFRIAYGSIGAGGTETRYLLNSPLTIYDDQNNLHPRLAQRVPTLENGDWSVTPDGRMETTWKLRPDVRWHDGSPFTAEDLVFSFRVARDPAFAIGTRVLSNVEEVVAVDPHTLVMRWKNVDISANVFGLNVMPPIARHLLQEPYDTLDKQAFPAHPYWSDQFIGLGPYRLQQWVRGSFIETVANDSYFLGRPQIDRILVRYAGDTRALLVSILAGEYDLVPVGSMKAEEAIVVKQNWEAAGQGALIMSMVKLRNGWIQMRDPTAPWVPDARVRQALVKLIDRPNMVETLHNRLSGVDDIFLAKEHPAYQLARQRGLPDLSYDPTQAHRLLTEAGLTRGPDGTYRTSSGVPFSIEASTSGDINTNVQEMLVIANAWQSAGLPTTQTIITTNQNSREMESTTKGVRLTSEAMDYVAFDGTVTSEISSEATRWRGRNSGGYSNPAYDELHSRLYKTTDLPAQYSIAADLVKFQLDNVLYLPLVYSPSFSAHRNGVRGITGILPHQRLNGWNVHLWEIA